jgi:hypothetical protein
MSIAYLSRYECEICGRYHKNGSKPQENCEKIMKEQKEKSRVVGRNVDLK